MSDDRFDTEALFAADDYYYFYGPRLSPERSVHEAALIATLLEIEAGMTVLDLACGHGRISNELSGRGVEMVGVDITPAFLDHARKEASRRGVSVDYVQDDMRALPWKGRFDRVINWFTSFGYFDDSGNRQVLSAVHDALKPRGRLLIELNNRDFILKHYQRASVVERDGNFMIDTMTFDAASGRNYTQRTILRDGRSRTFRFFVRMFTLSELIEWLTGTGFDRVDAYDQDGQPFTWESPRRMIVVASKGG